MRLFASVNCWRLNLSQCCFFTYDFWLHFTNLPPCWQCSWIRQSGFPLVLGISPLFSVESVTNTAEDILGGPCGRGGNFLPLASALLSIQVCAVMLVMDAPFSPCNFCLCFRIFQYFLNLWTSSAAKKIAGAIFANRLRPLFLNLFFPKCARYGFGFTTHL